MAQAYPRPQQGQGISKEVGGKEAPAGVWEHPESGQRAITIEDPLFGNAQSQGFKQLGFVFLREAEPEEIKTMPQMAHDTREGDEERFKGLSARLDILQGAHDENVILREEVEQLRKEKAERESKTRLAAEKAQAAAQKKAEKADAKPASKSKEESEQK